MCFSSFRHGTTTVTNGNASAFVTRSNAIVTPFCRGTAPPCPLLVSAASSLSILVLSLVGARLQPRPRPQRARFGFFRKLSPLSQHRGHLPHQKRQQPTDQEISRRQPPRQKPSN